MGTAVNGAADVSGMVFRTSQCRHNMDAAAVPRMVWTPQHTPNVGPWASVCYDPAVAFSVANRFLNMSVGVLSHTVLHCLGLQATANGLRSYFALALAAHETRLQVSMWCTAAAAKAAWASRRASRASQRAIRASTLATMRSISKRGGV